MKDQGDAKYFTTLLNRYKQQLYESCHDIVMTHFTFMVLWYILSITENVVSQYLVSHWGTIFSFVCRVPVICLVGWFECLCSEELQDIQLGLDWPLPGLCFFFCFCRCWLAFYCRHVKYSVISLPPICHLSFSSKVNSAKSCQRKQLAHTTKFLKPTRLQKVVSWFKSRTQGLKSFQSGCLEQVNFPSGQITFKAHLPNGPGSRQVIL